MTKTVALKLLSCKSAVHCRTCREDSDAARAWRRSVTGEDDFDCPFGVTASKLPSRGFGDTIEKLTRKLGIPSCGGCKRRRDKLNKALPYGASGKRP